MIPVIITTQQIRPGNDDPAWENWKQAVKNVEAIMADASMTLPDWQIQIGKYRIVEVDDNSSAIITTNEASNKFFGSYEAVMHVRKERPYVFAPLPVEMFRDLKEHILIDIMESGNWERLRKIQVLK